MGLWKRISIRLITCTICCCGLLYSQSIWTFQDTTTMIIVEYQHPSWKTEMWGRDFSVNLASLSARIKLASGNYLKIEVPYARLHADQSVYNYSYSYYSYYPTTSFTVVLPEINSATVGNIYAGIEIPTSDHNSVDIGMRFPTVSSKEEVILYAALSDYDRYEAFIPKYISLAARLNVANDPSNLFAVRFHMSPTLLVNTESIQQYQGGSRRFEFLLGASLQAGIQSENVDVLMGYSGRVLASGQGDISDRLVHQFGAMANAHINGIHPGIYYRIPLDKNLKYLINGVLGLSIGVDL